MKKSHVLIQTTKEVGELLDKISKEVRIEEADIEKANAANELYRSKYIGPDKDVNMGLSDAIYIDLHTVHDLLLSEPQLMQSIKIRSVETLLELIDRNPQVFQYIAEPSEKVISRALSIEGDLLQFIENPSLTDTLTAIESRPESIKYIRQPNEVQQVWAVLKDPAVLKYIAQPVPEIMEKAGWAVYNPRSEHSFKELPDQIIVTLETMPYYGDNVNFSSIYIELNEKVKQDLLTTGGAYLDYDDSPRFDISGGFRALFLEKDGTLLFKQETCVVEGGSVNFYPQQVMINKKDCTMSAKVQEVKAKEKEKKKPKLHK